MHSWTFSERSSLRSRVYRRQLATSELGFHWDGTFAGTGDTLQHVVIELKDANKYAHLSSIENVSRAWILLKQRFPLLACAVELLENEEEADFVLREEALYHARPGEITLKSFSSGQEVEVFNESIINGPRQLSSRLLSRIWILHRTDSPSHFHILTHVAHVITDGLSNAVILREFCNLLCAKDMPSHKLDLELRLSRIMPVEALHPKPNLSLPRRRWRQAIASVIYSLRHAEMKVSLSLDDCLNR